MLSNGFIFMRNQEEKSMWRLLMIALFSISLLGAAYVTWRFHQLGFVRRLAQKNRLLAWPSPSPSY